MKPIRFSKLLAFFFGICATLTLPPFYLFPLVIPAYGGLFYLLNRVQNVKQGAALGFFWGWGFFMTGLYWFVIALMTDPDKFAWLIPFALFALTAVIAIYTAIFGWLYTVICRGKLIGAFIFCLLWLAMEIARGTLFTGFPWNLGGYMFAMSDASIQLASLIGIYGLTAFAVLLGVLPVASPVAGIAVWLLFAAAMGWGHLRAAGAPHDVVEGVRLRLVQANIQQHHKWNPMRQFEGLRTHMELTREPGLDEITHVIWPETAVPYVLQDNSTLLARLGLTLKTGQYLLTGTLRPKDDSASNSLVAIDSAGQIIGQYDKHMLVPFGEFLPLRWLIPDFLETPVGMADLAPGEGVKTVTWAGLPPLSPLICYEVIFSTLSVDPKQRPSWLLSVTNDAWFGTSTAPYQHLAMARMRAVEQGVPMIRVANTGISAAFDAYGREIGRIPLNQKGILDVPLPVPSQNRTVYSYVIP